MKYTKCYCCGEELTEGVEAVKFVGDLFCNRECVNKFNERLCEDVEIKQSDCEYEYDCD